MPRFLRTIRFDPSDTMVFDKAAEPDEWAVPGGFAFCDCDPQNLTGKRRQAFANGFLSIESFGRSTFVTVGEIAAQEMEALVARLADHFVSDYGAPNLAAALPVARGEIAFAAELAQGQPINTLLAVARSFDEDDSVHEEFRTVVRSTEAPHARVWDVVEDKGEDNDGHENGPGVNGHGTPGNA